MNIRLKAALHTAGFLAITFISVFLVRFVIDTLTSDQIVYLFGAGGFVFLVGMLYSITLNRLEYEARIEEIRNQK